MVCPKLGIGSHTLYTWKRRFAPVRDLEAQVAAALLAPIASRSSFRLFPWGGWASMKSNSRAGNSSCESVVHPGDNTALARIPDRRRFLPSTILGRGWRPGGPHGLQMLLSGEAGFLVVAPAGTNPSRGRTRGWIRKTRPGRGLGPDGDPLGPSSGPVTFVHSHPPPFTEVAVLRPPFRPPRERASHFPPRLGPSEDGLRSTALAVSSHPPCPTCAVRHCGEDSVRLPLDGDGARPQRGRR